jgi:hypothetical protein
MAESFNCLIFDCLSETTRKEEDEEEEEEEQINAERLLFGFVGSFLIAC